jgi:hypothetical protein
LNLPVALLNVAITVEGLAVTKNPRVLVEEYITLLPVAEAALITAVWNVLGVTPDTGHKSIHIHARLFAALAYSTRKVTVLLIKSVLSGVTVTDAWAEPPNPQRGRKNKKKSFFIIFFDLKISLFKNLKITRIAALWFSVFSLCNAV